MIVAEGEINHNGNASLGDKMIRAAKKSGADAIKFQCFIADEFVSPDSSYYDIFKNAELKIDDFLRLRDTAKKEGIMIFYTAADLSGVEMIRQLSPPVIKIGSSNITNTPLLEACGALKIPVILSTGMSTIAEIKKAVQVLQKFTDDIILLHCVVSYPASIKDQNLRSIPLMAREFSYPIGFSDHTLGTMAAGAAVALGACLIEKHFTLDHGLEGPDHHFSANPAELEDLVKKIRDVESALGKDLKEPTADEAGLISKARRFIVARENIDKGKRIVPEILTVKRIASGRGLEPEHLPSLCHGVAKRPIKKNEPIYLEDVDRS